MIGQSLQYKRMKLLIVISSTLALILSTAFTLTTFSWNVDGLVYIYLLLYLLLIIALILVFSSVRIGYLIICLVSITYCLLLSQHIITFLLYNRQNLVLIPVLLIPFILYIVTIPLTVKILLWRSNRRKQIYNLLGCVLFSFIGYIVFNLAYNRVNFNIYADSTLMADGMIKMVCKPHFGDAREFSITSKSVELAKRLKEQGKLYQGTWNANVQGYGVVIAGNLKSLVITHIEKIKLNIPLEWKVNKVKGETAFILP
jgi:hypothetical protein